MNKYDVVIIGAGPGGLNCALELSKSNKTVLIVEQKKNIGPKVCAGGLTGQDLEYLNIPNKLLDFKLNQITVKTPYQEKKVKMKKNFVYTIDRKRLGQWQLKKLKKTSVDIKTGVRVTKIEKNQIILNNKEKIKYNSLVGADGSNSRVRKYLGLKTEKILCGMQYIIPTTKYKELELILDSGFFHSGYAWIFPHKGYASIGCCCNPDYLSGKKLRNNFEKWLKDSKINIKKGEFQAHPISYDYQGYKFGKTFLIGDAAGFASGYTGEGMYYALISGEEVAKMILNKRYKSKKINEILELKKTHENFLELLEKSSFFRGIEYEIIILLLKTRIFNKKLIKTFCP